MDKKKLTRLSEDYFFSHFMLQDKLYLQYCVILHAFLGPPPFSIEGGHIASPLFIFSIRKMVFLIHWPHAPTILIQIRPNNLSDLSPNCLQRLSVDYTEQVLLHINFW